MTYPYEPGHKGRDTGEAAAEAAAPTAPTLRSLVLTVLARGNFTADEIAGGAGHSVLAIRPRVSELARMGEIMDTGTRRKNASGKNAIVWTTCHRQSADELKRAIVGGWYGGLKEDKG